MISRFAEILFFFKFFSRKLRVRYKLRVAYILVVEFKLRIAYLLVVEFQLRVAYILVVEFKLRVAHILVVKLNKNDTLTTRIKRFYYILKEKEVLSTSTLNSQLEDNLFLKKFSHFGEPNNQF